MNGRFVSYVPLDRAKAVVDAVNNAKTKSEKWEAELVMRGYQMRCEEIGQRWPCIELDLSLPDDGRPVCCGVYLDWEPTA